MQNLKTINQAVEFIENNLYEQITVLDVAKSTSYSYFHFHRFFYLMTNETIGSYIRGRRLTQAAHDLNHTQKSITMISLSLGFETPESFTRAFKNRFGMTPSSYRKQGLDILIGNRPSLENFKLPEVKQLKPQIIYLEETNLVGIEFTSAQIKDGYVDAWRLFNKEYQQDFAKSDFYGVYQSDDLCNSDTFNLKCEAQIFIGTNYKNSYFPKKYNTRIIKGGRYAKFTYVGIVENMIDFYQYIWGVWVVSSGYELDSRSDFEIYTDRFRGEHDSNSEIDIYLPIK